MEDGNDASIATQSDNVHLKVLVPNVAAGAIIGRGGEAIAQIQREAGAKVKMAKQNDFYPGTAERVCLIVGTVEGVLMVHDYIVQHIREKRETLSPPGGPGSTAGGGLIANFPHGTIINPYVNSLPGSVASDNRQHGDRSQQVKILVPNSTAGMVIGKRGSYIREIKERSGAFIQISQKATDISLLERCITVAGDVEQCRKAVRMIVLKIASDPQSNVHPYTSYADVSGPVASAYPTGSPYAQRNPITTSAGTLGASVSASTPLTTMTGSYAASMIAPPSMLPLGNANAALTSGAAQSIMAAMSSPALLFNPGLGIFGSGNGPGLTLLSPTGSTSTGGNTPLTPGNSLRLVMGMSSANPAIPTLLPHDLYSPVGPVSPLFSLQQGAASPQGIFTTAVAPQQHQHQSLNSPVELTAANAAFFDQQQLAAAFHPQHQQALASLLTIGALSYAAGASPSSHMHPYQLSPTSATFFTQPQKNFSEYINVTRRDIQIPASCLSRIMDRQSEYQHQFGTSLRVMSSPLGTNGGPGNINASGDASNTSGTRIISISGPILGVQQTVALIQQCCNHSAQ